MLGGSYIHQRFTHAYTKGDEGFGSSFPKITGLTVSDASSWPLFLVIFIKEGPLIQSACIYYVSRASVELISNWYCCLCSWNFSLLQVSVGPQPKLFLHLCLRVSTCSTNMLFPIFLISPFFLTWIKVSVLVPFLLCWVYNNVSELLTSSHMSCSYGSVKE